METAMSEQSSKAIRSPSYPNMPLREAVAAVGRIEAHYRSSPVDREAGAKLVGYSSLSGPANQALAALASYGLVERAGKGEMRVTERARSILHPDTPQERLHALQAAALEPQLYKELRERFADIFVPPEDGVVNWLNRQGFNPSAVRPAARAFLQTMQYMEELGASESHRHEPEEGRQCAEPSGNGARTVFGGASVGDLIQWESDGVLRLERPLRVRLVTADGKWVAVEGSETGIPMEQVIVQERAGSFPRSEAPRFPVRSDVVDATEEQTAVGTDIRFQLGKGVVVQIRSKEELGPAEFDKLLTLIGAQKDVLSLPTPTSQAAVSLVTTASPQPSEQSLPVAAE